MRTILLKQMQSKPLQNFCDLNKKNHLFESRMQSHLKNFNIHQKISQITPQKLSEYVGRTQKQKIAYQFAQKASYDAQLKDFIGKFNQKNKDRVTLLNFSNYANQYGELVERELRKEDLEVLKEFQKRKVDQRIHQLKMKQNVRSQPNQYIFKKFPEYQMMSGNVYKQNQQIENIKNMNNKQGSRPKGAFINQASSKNHEPISQGPLRINDHFVMMLLDVRSNTKVTTLNRINSFKTLIFMGNGNGIISYAKGRGLTPSESLERTIYLCRKNVIAIPRDQRCTVPLPIKTRFQDYDIDIRSIPGFNPHGHPLIAMMLTLAGMDHCAFKVSHTDHNIYNVLKVFFRAATRNTTPQQLAQRQGFKVYRHQFVRPLTFKRTHHPLSQ